MVIASIVLVLAVLIGVGMVALVVSHKDKILETRTSELSPVPFALEGETALASPSIPPESAQNSSDGARSAVRAGMSPREALEAELRDRAASGRCLICPERATHAMPRRSLVRSFLDPLFRYYGIVASDRYRIDVHVEVDHPPCLCQSHHLIARSALERKSAEMTERYAAFVEKGRYEMLEYERFEVFETVLAHEQEIRGRKPQKKHRGSLAAVVSIGDKKAG